MKDDEVFEVGSAGKEVIGLDFGDLVLATFGKVFEVASLSGRVAGKINNGFG